jgi:hypothetical protein
MWTVPAIAADPTIDPCTLVKKAEVEQVIGRPTGNPTSESNDRVRMCTFLFSAEAKGSGVFFLLLSKWGMGHYRFWKLPRVEPAGKVTDTFPSHYASSTFTI